MASGGNTIGPEYIVGTPLPFNSANYGDDEFANYFKGPATDAASLFYAGISGGYAGFAYVLAEGQKVDRFNASARQHNERVLAARAQKKSPVGESAVANDNLPTKSKKPQPDISKEQTVATAGDTVPIVFCKRANFNVAVDVL